MSAAEIRQRHAAGNDHDDAGHHDHDGNNDGADFGFDASFGERAHARASDSGPSVGALSGSADGAPHAGWLHKRHERCPCGGARDSSACGTCIRRLGIFLGK